MRQPVLKAISAPLTEPIFTRSVVTAPTVMKARRKKHLAQRDSLEPVKLSIGIRLLVAFLAVLDSTQTHNLRLASPVKLVTSVSKAQLPPDLTVLLKTGKSAKLASTA